MEIRKRKYKLYCEYHKHTTKIIGGHAIQCELCFKDILKNIRERELSNK